MQDLESKNSKHTHEALSHGQAGHQALRKFSVNSADLHHDLSTEDGSPNKHKEDYGPTQIMYDRWQRSNALSIPVIDQKDIFEENPVFNHSMKHPKHQHHPEFTQSSYSRLRAMEEAFAMKNYLPPPSHKHHEKQSISQRIQNTIHFGKKDKEVLNHHDRSFGIQKIFDLHIKKEYKPETLFTAAGIFDRYLGFVGADNFPK